MIKVGFLAGTFDILHPGYVDMFKTAKQNCDYLVVGLHTDPTIERPSKIKPILSFEDRLSTLSSIRYIDEIRPYTTEADLELILVELKPNIRFLGDDYIDKPFTANYLSIPIFYIDRSHDWSSTKFKHLIYEQIKKQNNYE